MNVFDQKRKHYKSVEKRESAAIHFHVVFAFESNWEAVGNGEENEMRRKMEMGS
jgi:hypothetical protein